MTTVYASPDASAVIGARCAVLHTAGAGERRVKPIKSDIATERLRSGVEVAIQSDDSGPPERHIKGDLIRDDTVYEKKPEADGYEVRQVTRFEEYDVKWPSNGPDAIVFENGGKLHVLDLDTEQSKPEDIVVPADLPDVRSRRKSVANRIEAFSLSPSSSVTRCCSRFVAFPGPTSAGGRPASVYWGSRSCIRRPSGP